MKEKLCPDDSQKENIEVAIESTSTLFDLIKNSPIDLNHSSVASGELSIVNLIMLNMHDNGRSFHFDPKENYKWVSSKLLWFQFQNLPAKSTIVDIIEQELSDYGLNFHAYRDSLTSVIVKFEDSLKVENVIEEILKNHNKSKRISKILRYEEVDFLFKANKVCNNL